MTKFYERSALGKDILGGLPLPARQRSYEQKFEKIFRFCLRSNPGISDLAVSCAACYATLTLNYDVGYGQSLATNILKHLMNQLEKRILQTGQLKNTSKRL